MLHDPRHDKINFNVKPSLDGFDAFVSNVLSQNPKAWYWWRSYQCCAVASYLHSIGCYDPFWYDDCGMTIRRLDELAHGSDPIRDARGRFVSTDTNRQFAVPQWTYRALAERILEANP